VTHHGSHHKRLLPQVSAGENVLAYINMSAATYAARLAGDPLVARATKRMVERENKWRAERANDPTTPPIATARSRRRERRQREAKERPSPTAE
jgi:hypothetical protein